MSAERPPPVARPLRPAASSHTRPAESFLPADDVEDLPPEEVHELVEPTLAAVHRSVVRLEQQQAKLIDRVDAHIETDERRTGLIHEELALLRADLGLRVTAVEQTQDEQAKEQAQEAKAERNRLREMAAKAGQVAGSAGGAGIKWTLFASGAYLLASMAAKRWPELQGLADWLRTVPVP